MRPLVAILDRASGLLALVSAGAVVLLAIGFILALMLQVVFRYALSDPLSWTEELATLQFVWATLLSASWGVRNAEHLRLEFVADALPERLRSWSYSLCELLVAIFGVFLAVYGWRLTTLVWSNTSAAIGYPLYLMYISVPVTGVLIALHAVVRVLMRMTGRQMPEANIGAAK